MLRRLAWIGALLFCAAFTSRASAQSFEHSYAVVIGIDNYRSARFPKLSYAVKDAKAISAYLQGQGYDKVISLYNEQASKQAIMEAMQNSIAPGLQTNDRVLVFFAGHGYTEKLGGKDRGYLVPFDGSSQSASYISMEELETQSSYMGNARHQLFIMDSCYGGLLSETRASLVNPDVPNYIDEVTRRFARQVITAGGPGQQVLDGGPKGHSFFVDYLLEALQDGLADFNKDGYITFDELSAYLIPRASNPYQTPSVGILPGHGAGEYLFNSPATRAAVQAAPSRVTAGVRRGGDSTPAAGGAGPGSAPVGGDSVEVQVAPAASNAPATGNALRQSALPLPRPDSDPNWNTGWKYFSEGDYASALALLERCAGQGDFNCLETIAYAFDNGKGLPQDHLKAVEYYRRAAVLGDVKAMTELVYRYEHGFFEIKKDLAESLRWLRAAAEKGDGMSMFRLGEGYEQGVEGLQQQDLDEAVRWYRKASVSNDSAAANNAQIRLKRLGK